MNIEKMKQFIELKKELEKEGVYGFTFHENGFHTNEKNLINEPNLQMVSRGSDDYPYEIYVQYEDLKVYAIIQTEQLKDFPQFKEQAKAELRKQLAELEKEEEAAI